MEENECIHSAIYFEIIISNHNFQLYYDWAKSVDFTVVKPILAPFYEVSLQNCGGMLSDQIQKKQNM